ncbi:MAG: hypothetical protein U1F15_01905 [Burkholderiales bacterium]
MTALDREADGCERDSAERFVVEFLRARPGAADTIEGIARWWFEANANPINPAVLEQALVNLAARGVMQARVLPSGETLWSAAPAANGRTPGPDPS